jgi:hypothetical protein
VVSCGAAGALTPPPHPAQAAKQKATKLALFNREKFTWDLSLLPESATKVPVGRYLARNSVRLTMDLKLVRSVCSLLSRWPT